MRSSWVYLNVEHPLVAWLVYRGEMFSAEMVHVSQDTPWTPLSLFRIGRLRSPGSYKTELAIDEARRQSFPEKSSRLSGFFVFADEDSARRAERAWDGNFRSEFLCEVGVATAPKATRYDSNWITHEFGGGPGDWMEQYVAGAAYNNAPLWEHVVEGTALVYGTALRERAYVTVRRTWPESLALLELGRIAVELGSSLGRIVGLPVLTDGNLRVRYILDMVDADQTQFLDRVKAFVEDPSKPVNHADLAPLDEERWFRTPDLAGQEFNVIL